MRQHRYMWNPGIRINIAIWKIIKTCIDLLGFWYLNFGVRNSPIVKGWGFWLINTSSIPSAGSHFWFNCGVPSFLLDGTLRNRTKNTGGPLCVCTHHMQSKNPPLPLHIRSSRSRQAHWYKARFGWYGLRCTLERITLFALKTIIYTEGPNLCQQSYLEFLTWKY